MEREEERKLRWGCTGAASGLAFDPGQPAIIDIILLAHVLKGANCPTFVVDVTRVISWKLHATLWGRLFLPPFPSWGN